MDVTDPALKTPQDADIYAQIAKSLVSMMPIIAPCYGTSKLQAVCAERKAPMNFLDFGKLKVMIMFQNPLNPAATNGMALGVQTAEAVSRTAGGTEDAA